MGAEKKAWLGPGQENGDQAWLKMAQHGHLSSYTPVSEAAPGLLTPGSSGPSLRTHGT